MNLFNVYPLWDIEPVKAKACSLWDKKGEAYLDLYGGHAVISIGHSHPKYIEALHEQVKKIGFYSNSVQNSLQKELAREIGQLSGYDDYSLFLCNSGAEANENALKLASFHTSRKRILALKKAFHGRTSGAVESTDNPKIQAQFNRNGNVSFIPINDREALVQELATGEYAALIIEGIQGVAGIFEPDDDFLRTARAECDRNGTLLILDEIQSGCGRTGKFFAHQHCEGFRADLVTMAKGIANGFPMGAVVISPAIEASYGLLGTTFGGNHLACAAALATMKIIREEHLVENSRDMGEYLLSELKKVAKEHTEAIAGIRGKGLMIGVELKPGHEDLRNRLLFEKHIFTGAASNKIIRLLPPLCISKAEIDHFIQSLKELLQ